MAWRGRRHAPCLGVAAMMCAMLAAGCGAPDSISSPRAGNPLPNLQLDGLMDGRALSTASLRGKVLLINFWASWCEPCRKEMPSLEALSRRYGSERLAVFGVSVDADENLAREFVLQSEVTFPNFTERARDVLRVRALPETVIVSADGIVVARVTGAR